VASTKVVGGMEAGMDICLEGNWFIMFTRSSEADR
jgi:hypothetical protein